MPVDLSPRPVTAAPTPAAATAGADTRTWHALGTLLQLGLALLQAGHTTHAMAQSLRRVAAAWQLNDLVVLGNGRAIVVEYTKPCGTAMSRTGDTPSIDAFDCEQMRELAHVVSDIESGRMQQEAAAVAIAQVLRTKRSPWWTIGGGALLALCVSLQVDGTLWSALGAACVYPLVSLTGRWLGAFHVSRIYAVALQCVVAAVAAAALHGLGLLSVKQAAVCVAVNWMLLVPLPQVISMVVDTVNSDAHAALARAASLLLAVEGILLGGLMVLAVGRQLPITGTTSVDLPTLPLLASLVFSMLGAMGNAMANSGGPRLLQPAAVVGLLTACCNQFLQRELGVSGTWSAPLTAVALGFGAAYWARRLDYPASALALMGLTGALLPGLVVYQGLMANLNHGSGQHYFVQAGLTCLALGVGTAFGYLLETFTQRSGRQSGRGRCI